MIEAELSKSIITIGSDIAEEPRVSGKLQYTGV